MFPINNKINAADLIINLQNCSLLQLRYSKNFNAIPDEAFFHTPLAFRYMMDSACDG